MSKTKIAINGYGNLGRAVELAVRASDDMEAVVIFTRRDPDTIDTYGTPVDSLDNAEKYVADIDVCICCGGSATDLRTQGPDAAVLFNTVDSFDTHADIPQYLQQMDRVARDNDHLSMISTGWDPGLFSIARIYSQGVLPKGQTTTFWGPGVSQGHSDAIRRIDGVAAAVQYTIPREEAKQAVLDKKADQLTTSDKHRRECYVVAEDGADRDSIKQAIVSMPKYFADYETTVHFITMEQMRRDHAAMPHGGEVIHVGSTSDEADHSIRFALQLESNPEFTGAMVAASARAVSRLAAEGQRGCITVADVAPRYYNPNSREQVIADLV